MLDFPVILSAIQIAPSPGLYVPQLKQNDFGCTIRPNAEYSPGLP